MDTKVIKYHSDIKHTYTIKDFFNEDLSLNWDWIWTIPCFKDLYNCKQNTEWHHETVVEHVVAVCDAMSQILHRTLNKSDVLWRRKYRIMMVAALCHDLGKAVSNVYNTNTQQWTSPNHALHSAIITRFLLAKEVYFVREAICWLVEHHMHFHHFFDENKRGKEYVITRQQNHLARLSMGYASIKALCQLYEADCLGSTNDIESPELIQEHVDYIVNMATDMGCYTKHYELYDYRQLDALSMKWHNGKLDKLPLPEVNSNIDVSTLMDYYKDSQCIHVMIGIPGCGKNTMIDNMPLLQDLPVLSRDDIRTNDLHIPGEKPLGTWQEEQTVTQIFNERFMDYCKNKQSFVINNVNLYRKTRMKYKLMAKDYNPVFFYHLLTTPLDICLERRKGQIDEKVIIDMFQKYQPPTADEMCILWVDGFPVTQYCI